MRRHNLISLISVICILLVGMAMTGCATTTQLGTAAHGGDIREVEALLNKGVDVNENVMGVTPLIEAVAYNASLDIVRLLLDKGADVNKDTVGWRPIHYAVKNGNANVVKLLLDRGADINVLNGFKETPLKMAEERGATVIARMLREAEEKQYKKLYAKDEKLTPSPTAEKPSVSTIKSDVDEPLAVKADPRPDDLAIVIGIEKYQTLPKSDYSKSDAGVVKDYLKALGFQERNIEFVIDERATKSKIETAIEGWLPNKVKKDSRVVVYYSGHGAPDPSKGEAYIVPYDGDPNYLTTSGYSLKRLYDNLGKLQAKEIIVALDSCFSGAGGRSVLAKGARPLVMTMEKTAIPLNTAVLSASSGEQISSTYEEKGHGLFTYFMLKGIKGEGDTNGDGKIEIGELFEYIKPQVERIARKIYNNEQLPQLIAPEERHRMILIEGAK